MIEREWPGQVAKSELRSQWEFLNFLRITAYNKVSGLSRDLAAATPWPTSPYMSLLGVIKHLTAVERFWLVRVGGETDDLPSLWTADPNADFQLTADDTTESVLAAYRREWSNAEAALAGASLNDVVTHKDENYTIRWILAHVVQETARHVGHVDILRELADGSTGE